MSKTVLLTGATGYIGSWICRYLLENGYTVRASVRNKSNAARYAHLETLSQDLPGKLEFWEADLLKPGSYDEAARGSDYVFHVASPFLLKYKDAQKELIDPALLGTRNVLEAATRSGTVQRVVLTSSVASIYGDAKDMQDLGLSAFNETHWNSTSNLKHQEYSYSKTLAERAAWEIATNQQQWSLVTINPSFVFGPPIGDASDSGSMDFLKQFLSGKYFGAAPLIRFGFVDVREVAIAHLRAAELPHASGRYILSNIVLSTLEIGKLLGQNGGNRLVMPFLKAPKKLVAPVAPLFGVSKAFVLNNADYPLAFDNSRSIRELGIQYRDFKETLREMVERVRA